MVWWKKAKTTESHTGAPDAESTADAEDASQEPETQTQAVESAQSVEVEPVQESAESVQAEDDSVSIEAEDSAPGEAEDSADITETAESDAVEGSADAESTGAESDQTAEVAESEDSAEIAESDQTAEIAESDQAAEIVESEETAGVAVEDSAEAESVTTDTDTADDMSADTADDTSADTVDQTVLTEDAQSLWAGDSAAPDFAAPPGTSLTGSDTIVYPVSSSAGVPVVPVKSTTGHGFRNTILTIVGSVLGAVLLVVGCGAVGTSYFDSHAKPGAELAGRDITGFSMTQVRNVAATLIENYTATLEFNGKQADASAKQLGITFDLDKTVGEAMSAGSTDAVSDRYNPFNAKKTLLAMSVDEDKLLDYLNATFISDDQRSVPAEVVYDGDQGSFVVQSGKDGTEADAAKVAQELEAGNGISEPLIIATTAEPPRITDDTAQQTADAANQLLAAPYTVTAAGKDYTIPVDSIASWVTFTSDQDAGTIQMSIDSDKATADLPAMLTDNLSKPVVPQQNLYSPDGRYLGVQKSGSTGTDIADPDGVAAQVVQALVAGSGLDATVDTKATPFPEDKVTIADGVKWVEVNRSNYTVTRWEGGNSLSTWSVVIGKPSTPTYTGIFHVWAKVPLQDMKGADYLQPNVPWSAYFNGDIALHGNYWVGSFGWGSSHGCVGMPVAQAEIMYNWIEIGTLVVVHD